MKDEFNFTKDEILEKELEEYLNIQNSERDISPISDIGHSYSYQSDNNEKLIANLMFIKPEVKKILSEYNDIIKNDNDLYEKLLQIDQFFIQNSNQKVDKSFIEKKFENIIVSIEQTAEDEQRIDHESPNIAVSNNSKATKFFELKNQIDKIKEKCLETY